MCCRISTVYVFNRSTSSASSYPTAHGMKSFRIKSLTNAREAVFAFSCSHNFGHTLAEDETLCNRASLAIAQSAKGRVLFANGFVSNTTGYSG